MPLTRKQAMLAAPLLMAAGTGAAAGVRKLSRRWRSLEDQGRRPRAIAERSSVAVAIAAPKVLKAASRRGALAKVALLYGGYEAGRYGMAKLKRKNAKAAQQLSTAINISASGALGYGVGKAVLAGFRMGRAAV